MHTVRKEQKLFYKATARLIFHPKDNNTQLQIVTPSLTLTDGRTNFGRTLRVVESKTSSIHLRGVEP